MIAAAAAAQSDMSWQDVIALAILAVAVIAVTWISFRGR